MVARKRPTFGAQPTPLPPAADQWASAGGVDPEIQQVEGIPSEPTTVPPAVPEQQAEPEPEEEDEQADTKKPAKKFPHRVSFDMETPQYKRLKRASFEVDRPMNEVLREAVEGWLKEKGY